MTVPNFLSEYWERRPLVIPGAEEKFSSLQFDSETLRHVFAVHPNREMKAQCLKGDGQHVEIDITADQADRLFDAGLTICLSSLEDLHPPFRDLTIACKTFLNLAEAVDVTCYWSPAGGGFGTHFDRQSVLIVQLEGTKRWRHSPVPAVAFPGKNFLAVPGGDSLFARAFPWIPSAMCVPDDDQMVERLLTPGDALYLPSGTWHRTQAGNSSLALTLTFFHRTFASFLPDLLHEKLDRFQEWRAPVPLVPIYDAPVFGLPAALEEFFAHRLAQLKTMVGKLEPDDFAQLWRSEVSRFRFPIHGDQTAPSTGEVVARDDVFEVPQPVFCVAGRQGDCSDLLHVFFGDRHITLPMTACVFIGHLAGRSRFTATAALNWSDNEEVLSWSDVQQALGTLLSCHLIVRS